MSQFFEPWRAAPPRMTPEEEAARNIPCPPDLDPATWDRGFRKPDCVLVWGTGMMPPDQSPSFSTRTAHGSEVVVPIPGDRIVVTIKPPINDRGVTSAMIASRIVECVNAMAEIKNPVQWMKLAKSQLENKGAA